MDSHLIELYHPGMTEEQLANQVLYHIFGEDMPSIPIDPFKMMRNFGIVYQFMEFEDLEGIYLVPETADDISMVSDE